MTALPLRDHRLCRPAGVFVCVAIGLCIGRWVGPPPVWAALLAAALALAACVRVPRSSRAAFVAISLVGASAAWWTVRIEHAPARALYETAQTLERRPLVMVEGVIAETPRVRTLARGVFARHARPGVSTHTRLACVRFPDHPDAPRGSLWLTIGGRVESVHAGDRVRVWGRLAPAGARRNPGDPPYRLRALESGVVGFLSTPSVETVEALGAGAWWPRVRARVRARATGWLAPARDADDPASALLLAALTGERVESLHEADAAVRRVGAAHLLAISGLHLTFLVTMGVVGVRLVRDPGRAEPLIGAALALVYLALTPARAPIVRAAGITVAIMAGEAAGTRWRREALLAWAATFTVLWRPTELFSPGFQLSYACVGALVMFAGPVRVRLFREQPVAGGAARDPWAWRATKAAIASTLVAWLVATPILAHHLGVVNPLGALVVLLVTPLFSLVLALGFLTSALSLISPALAGAIAPAALAMSDIFLAFVLRLESLPLMVAHLPRAPLALTSVVFMAVVWWLWAPRSLRAAALCAGVIGVALTGWLWRSANTNGLAPDVALRIDMLDIGDGSFLLVRTPEAAMLWDVGAQDLSFGARRAPASLRALGAWRVPVAIITHANLDHFAALPDIAESVGLRRVFASEGFLDEAGEPDSAAAALVRELAIAPTRLVAGDALALPGADARVLWPPSGYASDRANDHSLVLRVSVMTGAGERSALFTGDIEPKAARALFAGRPGLSADVLELPHHGSARLAPTGFVESIDPRVVMQSSGRSRLGDERWDDARNGRRWLMTAEVGAAWVEITREGEVRSGAVRLSE